MNFLQQIVDNTVAAVLEKFQPVSLAADQIAMALVDLRDTANPVWATYRGDVPFYPASVIKLFYMVAAHQQMEAGILKDHPELRRAMRDMIVDSGNESTGYVIDAVTDTTSGLELPPAELAAWHEKRNVINRYFHSHGYPEINANRKTWHEGPYGRDRQAVEQFVPARNSLTANATARLLVEIYSRRCISAERSEQMLELMKRDVNNPDYQAREFTAAVMLPTAKVWSKAGYMSQARHDAALVELANGWKYALVVFTERCSDHRGIIPEFSRQVLGQVV